jgi:hypothetical protein
MTSRVLFGLLFAAWVGEAPPELDGVLYSGLWRSPFEIFAPLFVPIPGIRLFGLQLLLIALVPLCATMPSGLRHRAPEMSAAILVSLASIGITVVWGLLRGGGAYQAYYQLWRFLAALLVAYLLMSFIRRPRDLQTLALTIVTAALIRGTLVTYFYWAHVRDKIAPAPEYMTNHDDSLLFVAAIVITGVWAMLTRKRGAWMVAAFVLLWLFNAMVLNNRRLAWVELSFAITLIYVLIGAGPLRRRINRCATVIVPLALGYLAVGWGREEALFAPIRALTSAGSDGDASSLARLEEMRNLIYTMWTAGNPLLGTGWGLPYQKVSSFYANYSSDWVLALYTPHNSLLGLAAFAGLVGILGIWGVVPVAAYLAARGCHKSTDPVICTASIAAICILAAYSVQCYGDIGLQSLPCGLMLGVALATAGKVGAWTRTTASTKPIRASSLTAVTVRGAVSANSFALPSRVQTECTARNAASVVGHDVTVHARRTVARRRRT